MTGNPRALKKGKRFTEYDLNRAAPGSLKAKEYEKRRAKEILDIASKYQYVIDIHGTVKNAGIFIIITNLSEDNLKLASMLDIPRIVVWPSFSGELKGPLSEFFRCGLEIECGPKNSHKIKKELKKNIIDFLENYKLKEKYSFQKILNILAKKEINQVYGNIERSEEELEEFTEVKINNETFFPLLIGSYNETACYKMKKINIKNLFKEDKK